MPPLLNWAESTIPELAHVRDLAFGEGVFVAVGDGTTRYNGLATSVDGINWTERTVTLPSGDHDWTWHRVVYGNGRFVASTYSTTDDGVFYLTAFSTDGGESWTTRAQSGALIWLCTAFGGGKFVAIANAGGYTRTATSTNGHSWHEGGNIMTATPFPLRAAYGNGMFVSPTVAGFVNSIVTSPNGVTWTGRTPFSPSTLAWAVAFGNGRFVAVSHSEVGGGDGTSDLVATSSDGISWVTRHNMPSAAGWWAVTFGDGLFLATSFGGDGAVASSIDGITWVTVSPPLNFWVLGTHGNQRFVLAGLSPGGPVAASPSSEEVKRYLRMTQRNDGLGAVKHPRLTGTSSNTPTSAQLGKPQRLGQSNRYI